MKKTILGLLSATSILAALPISSVFAQDASECIITQTSALISDFDMSPFLSPNTSSGANSSTFLIHGSISQPLGNGLIGFLTTFLGGSSTKALKRASPLTPPSVTLPEKTWVSTASLSAPDKNPTTAYVRLPEVSTLTVANEVNLTSLVTPCDWLRYRMDYLSIRPFVLTQSKATAKTLVLKEIPTKGLTFTQMQNFLNDIEANVGTYGPKAIQSPTIYSVATYGKLFRFNVLDLVTNHGVISPNTGKYMITLWGAAQQ